MATAITHVRINTATVVMITTTTTATTTVIVINGIIIKIRIGRYNITIDGLKL